MTTRQITSPKARAIACACLSAILVACNNSPSPSPQATVIVPVVTIFAPPTSQPATTTAPSPQTTTAAPTPLPSAPAPSPSAPTGAWPTFAPNVNPFTGLVMSDTAALKRRALLVKVANTANIRPQTGLSLADVAVEHTMEGGDTRISALYLTNAATKIGSVRSCRLVDIELTNVFNSGLVCSGTSPGVKPIIRAATHLFDRGAAPREGVAIISDFGPFECPTCPMFRTSDRVPPDNLFGNTVNSWKELDERKRNTPSAFHSFWFDANVPAGGKPSDSVSIKYRVSPTAWTFDKASGLWQKATSGRPFTDAATGKPISAANVLVLQAPHIDTDIEEDVLGSKSIQIQLWNSGNARLYRDGQVFEGVWKRDASTGMNNLDLRDRAGKPLMFKPGNTWIQIVATADQVGP